MRILTLCALLLAALLGGAACNRPSTPTLETKDGYRQAQGKSETVVGTVTRFEPGKAIAVQSDDQRIHSFGLDEQNLYTQIDPAVAVGSKVTLLVRTDPKGYKTIEVAVQNPA